jgi:hypothetical protein
LIGGAAPPLAATIGLLAEWCSSGRIHGVDVMLDHRAEIDLVFTQFSIATRA